MAASPAVAVNRLSKYFPQIELRRLLTGRNFSGSWALREVDLELWPGESLSIVGPNGTGHGFGRGPISGVDRSLFFRKGSTGELSLMLLWVPAAGGAGTQKLVNYLISSSKATCGGYVPKAYE
jgi:hypothetical protein